MQPLEDILTESNGPSVAESDFFTRPPMRSYQFVAGTLTLLLALGVGCLVLARHWDQIQTMSIYLAGFAAFSMVFLWVRIYQIFQKLHETYSHAKLDVSFVHSPVDKVLRNAGDLMSATLYFAFTAAMLFFLALGSSFSHH
jgi:hypothetical protein